MGVERSRMGLVEMSISVSKACLHIGDLRA